MRRASLALVAIVVWGGGCSAILDFNQCSTDPDCASLAPDGGVAYCTADHICVSDVPSDRLCKVSPAGSTDSAAITVAGLFRLSGPNDVVDTALADAVELGVMQINTAGRQLVRLVECDTNGDPDQARKALTVAVKNFGAVAAVGPTSSGEVIALAQEGSNLVTQYGVLIVSPSATSPSITSLQDEGLVWRTCASDSLQAKELANLAAAMSPAPTSATVAYVNSSYGIGLSSAFVSATATIDPALHVSSAPAFNPGTPGTQVVSALGMGSPQVALIVADSDAPAWVAALNDGGTALATTQFLLTDGALTPSLFSDMPNSSVLMRITGTAPGTPSGAAFNTFASIYSGDYPFDPADTAFVANSYDAIYAIVIAMGVVPAGTRITGREIIAGMKLLSDPMGKPEDVGINDFSDAYDRLSHGGTVNLNGTSGPIDFDSDTGDVVTAPIEVWSVDTSTTPPTFKTLQTVNP